ncbi:MAG: ATP-binding cassette domain-containing protein, partial [Myxococcota bacterium]
PELSGLENLEFLLSIASSAKAAKHSRSDLRKALEDVGLAREAVDRRVSTYSKGMRQRVGIALASVRRSPAVLLDEPTSGLDPRAADELDALIRRLADDGAAVVMATHDIYRAAHVGSRFGYLSDGRLTDPVEGPISPAELDEFCRASTRVAA